jgi:hypothetical protein
MAASLGEYNAKVAPNKAIFKASIIGGVPCIFNEGPELIDRHFIFASRKCGDTHTMLRTLVAFPIFLAFWGPHCELAGGYNHHLWAAAAFLKGILGLQRALLLLR